MKLKRLIWVVVLLIFAAVALSTSATEEFLNPSKEVGEVAGNPGAWEGKRFQLFGYVVPGSVSFEPGSSLNFTITDGTYTMRVVHYGEVPSAFPLGRNFSDQEVGVMAIGTLQGGVFYSEKLLVKCPSKYEASAPQE